MSEQQDVAASFTRLAERIRKKWSASYPIDQPFISSIGWQSVSLTPSNIASLSDSVSVRLTAHLASTNSDASSLKFWQDIAIQADLLTFENLSSDPINVIGSTLQFLTWTSSILPPLLSNVDWDAIVNRDSLPKTLSRKLSAIEARIAEIEPRTENLRASIQAIEDAREAADRLPTDMAELRKARGEIASQLSSSTVESAEVSKMTKQVIDFLAQVSKHEKDASELVTKCHESYRITTSAGLAGAFSDRSKSLQITGWVWVGILALALVAGSVMGAWRFNALMALIGDGATAKTSIIFLHFLGALMGVGAAVWIAWVSTKNISQSFKLSEDYAFKSSVSKAYEGYRREAVNLDQEFAKRLFGSALSRLDEPPSRFIDTKDHATPLEALLQNESFKELLKSVPEFRELLVNLASDGKSSLAAAAGAIGASLTRRAPIEVGKTGGDKDASA